MSNIHTSFSLYIKESNNKLSYELSNITTSKGFKDFLDFLGGGSSPTMTKELLVSGWCEDLAFYLSKMYNAKIVSLDNAELGDGHYFILKDGKYYDALSPEGVNRPSDLEWSKRLMNRKGFDSDFIDSQLNTDYDGGHPDYEKYFNK